MPKEVAATTATPYKNIFRIDDAPEWFTDNEHKSASIWIDEEKETHDRDYVAFRGAFLLDQYGDDGEGEPTREHSRGIKQSIIEMRKSAGRKRDESD